MADLYPILQEVKGAYSDVGRDQLPPGMVWDSEDWIPTVLQAGARGRGAWGYLSDPLPNPPDGMLFAPYKAGSRLLVCDGPNLHRIDTTAKTSSLVGAISPTRQNPFMHRDRVVVPAADGATLARIVTFDGGSWALADAPVGSLKGMFGVVWKDRTVLGGSTANPTGVGYSKPGDPTLAWDSLSLVNTSFALTGLAAQRTQVLCFHASSVERLRGTTPPDSTLSNPTGDLILDVLFDRAGCYDARSICNWNDNVLFADERGVQLTDGAIVRNLTVQGGLMSSWRTAFERGGSTPVSLAAVVHRDYYLVTMRHLGFPPLTYVFDIPSRRGFKLGNVDSTCFGFNIGAAERLYGVDSASKRVTDLTNMFTPDTSKLQVDGNGVAVLPMLTTGFNRLGRTAGFKRMVDAHVTYVADCDGQPDVFGVSYVNTPTAAEQPLDPLKPSAATVRAKLPVRRRMEGVALTLQQLVPTRDSRLYDISMRAYAEEPSRL